MINTDGISEIILHVFYSYVWFDFNKCSPLNKEKQDIHYLLIIASTQVMSRDSVRSPAPAYLALLPKKQQKFIYRAHLKQKILTKEKKE